MGIQQKLFNQQVQSNIKRIDEDFRFRLSKEEAAILRSKNLTSSWGGIRYLPYAFTESGIYMLMTVLKGELATQQSKALIRTFRAMKDYIIDNKALLYQHDMLLLSDRIHNMQNEASSFTHVFLCTLRNGAIFLPDANIRSTFFSCSKTLNYSFSTIFLSAASTLDLLITG